MASSPPILNTPESKEDQVSSDSELNKSSSDYGAKDLDSQTARTMVLVLFTGGTIGMKVNESGVYENEPNFLLKELRKSAFHDKKYAEENFTAEEKAKYLAMPLFDEGGKRIVYKVIEYEELMDSSNMSMSDWSVLAADILEHYDHYDGFVVLHGTDTMAYTASALSFMCEHLGKPVILTGSQIPIFEVRSDGRDNFLCSVIIAGSFYIPEVLICFNNKLFRGNRTTKIDSGSFDAFDSPNLAPLATLEIKITVDWPNIFHSGDTEKFGIQSTMCPNVGVLRIFPGITKQTVRSFLQPPMQGVVLETYGFGNAPINRPDLIQAITEATNVGVIIVNTTQCLRGYVSASYATGKFGMHLIKLYKEHIMGIVTSKLVLTYSASQNESIINSVHNLYTDVKTPGGFDITHSVDHLIKALMDAGVILGSDITPEAALAKLSYILAKDDWSLDKKRAMMKRNLRGEMTVVTKKDITIMDLELIESVAKTLSLSSKEEILKVRDALYPNLMCAAAQHSDLTALEKLRQTGGNLSSCNQDGRTALHVAARLSHLNVIQYLLHHGANVHIVDNNGHTPLFDAVRSKNLHTIRLMVQTGAILNLHPIKIAMEMCCCVAQDDLESVQAWVTAGADINVGDYDKRTPLHVAVGCGALNIVRYLLQNDARCDIVDAFGNTAIFYAEQRGSEELVNMFRGHEEPNNLTVGNNLSKPSQ